MLQKIRHTVVPRNTNQQNLQFSSNAQLLYPAAHPNSPPASLPSAVLCLQPTFNRCTSGNCLGTLRTLDFLFSLPPPPPQPVIKAMQCPFLLSSLFTLLQELIIILVLPCQVTNSDNCYTSIFIPMSLCGQGCAVGLATSYGLDDLRIESR